MVTRSLDDGGVILSRVSRVARAVDSPYCVFSTVHACEGLRLIHRRLVPRFDDGLQNCDMAN